MYPTRLLIALGVVVFLVAGIFQAPLRVVLTLLPESSVLRQAVAEGTVAVGHLQLDMAGQDAAVSWELNPWRLLLLGVGGDWRVYGDGLEASGTFAWHLWGAAVEVAQATVEGERLRPLLALTADIDQPLQVQQLQVFFWPSGSLRAAEGRLAFGPGQLRLRERAQPISLPALRGVVDSPEWGHVGIEVDGETDPGKSLAYVELNLDASELHVVVRQRAAALFGVTPGAAGDPDAAFFEVRQPLP